MRKIFSVIISVIIGICCLAACDNKQQNTPKIPEGAVALSAVPVYPENGKEMLIAAWDAPKHSYESYKYAKDMGLNHIFVDTWRGTQIVPGAEVGSGSRDMEEMQEWFTSLNLKGIWQCGVNKVSDEIGTFDKNFANYSCMAGINIYDEPHFNMMDKLKIGAADFDKTYGDKLFYFTNLWPSSANASSDIGADYTTYVNAYKEVLSQIKVGRRIASFDIYPLMVRGDEKVLEGSYLTNLHILKTAAKETNSDFHVFIQSVGYTMHRQPKTEEEIRFQVWTDMCFGLQGYTYFTYSGSGTNDSWKYTKAIVNPTNGKPYDMDYYNGCKRVNNEILKNDNVFLNFDWQGVLVSLGDGDIDTGLFSLGDYAIEQPKFIKSFSSSAGAVGGVFKDKDGNNGFCVTNYTDPYLQISNNIKLNFPLSNNVMMWRKGEYSLVPITDGDFEIQLESGEGVYLVPVWLENKA